MSKFVPPQKPGKSEQVVETPDILIDKVKRRLVVQRFNADLAADAKNTKAAFYYDEAKDALKQPWSIYAENGGWNWCNPPYADIRPWVKKAFDECIASDAMTAMLVPASVGSNWWADYVDRIAHVLFLQGRVTFVGHTKPYPKDLALLLYSPIVFGGYEVWDWREEK